MKSMFFTSLGSKESISSLSITTPFSLNCTAPLFIKAVTAWLTGSTRTCGNDSLLSKLYPFVDALRCVSDGIINRPSTFVTTRAASTVTSSSCTSFGSFAFFTSSWAPTGSTKKPNSNVHNTFFIA